MLCSNLSLVKSIKSSYWNRKPAVIISVPNISPIIIAKYSSKLVDYKYGTSLTLIA